MTRKARRMWLVLTCLVGLGGATALALVAFSSDIVFFMAPSQLLEQPPPADRTVRLGGMVVAGSLRHTRQAHKPVALFDVTDGQRKVTVEFEGVLPDLFREGQSVVAIGSLGKNLVFHAAEVLAKHDETYMPKEVADALRKSGRWDPRFGPPPSAASWAGMTREGAARVPPAAGGGAPEH